MGVYIKLPLCGALLFILVSCGSNNETSALLQSNIKNHEHKPLSWKIPYHVFEEEMMALQETYEEGGWESAELTIKNDTINKKYLFTLYPEGVEAYKLTE